MYFWAKTFFQNGWDVFSFSEKGFKGTLEAIHFISNKIPRLFLRVRLGLFQEMLSFFRGILLIRPDVVIVRGACRVLYPLSIICNLYKIKLVFFGASDVNFVKGRDGNGFNVRLYRKALKRTRYIVAQNQFQCDKILKNYNRSALVLLNIWNAEHAEESTSCKYDAIWVSNLSPVKQAEMFLEIAQKCPQYRFAIVGGVRDKDYYDKIFRLSLSIKNLDFLGYKNFYDITKLISSSKLLVCTSEHEGFPNTFLQAWSMGVPVVSTVNPSEVITRYNLGSFAADEQELLQQSIAIISNDEYRKLLTSSIKKYFSAFHDSTAAYSKLIDYMYG